MRDGAGEGERARVRVRERGEWERGREGESWCRKQHEDQHVLECSLGCCGERRDKLSLVTQVGYPTLLGTGVSGVLWTKASEFKLKTYELSRLLFSCMVCMSTPSNVQACWMQQPHLPFRSSFFMLLLCQPLVCHLCWFFSGCCMVCLLWTTWPAWGLDGAAGDGVSAAHHILRWGREQRCPDPQLFIAAMDTLFQEICDIHSAEGINLDRVSCWGQLIHSAPAS